jgi:ABC-type sugar transport system ATPase subunit
MSATLLEADGLRKTYGGVVALDSVSFSISAGGVVHALCGENGSGKSTLLGILSGQVVPDAGELWLDGQRVDFRSPADAIRHGVAMVSQETSVAPDLSVAENVLMGRLRRGRGRAIDYRATRAAVEQVLARLGAEFRADAVVRDLRPDQQQLVEIARALSMEARILILDEPTSSLTQDEAEALTDVVRELRAGGVTTLFVSHRMPEVLALADELTVLRDGRVALSAPASGETPDTLVSAMLGPTKAARHDEEVAPRRSAPAAAPPILELEGLTAPGAFEGITLSLRPGEVVGIAGLEGAGRSELLESVFGERATSAGVVRYKGEPLAARDPRKAIDNGIGYLPPDRKERGVVLTMSVSGNASVVGTLDVPRWRRPPRDRERRLLDDVVRVTRLRMGGPGDPVATLSGGNQQKVALGKWLSGSTELLLLDEPTRGIDVGAKLEIHALLRKAADDGAAILVSSSENEELLAVSDRIVVMARRRMVADLHAGEASLELLTRYAREGTHVHS